MRIYFVKENVLLISVLTKHYNRQMRNNAHSNSIYFEVRYKQKKPMRIINLLQENI